jgi:hypothetical protein
MGMDPPRAASLIVTQALIERLKQVAPTFPPRPATQTLVLPRRFIDRRTRRRRATVQR